MKFLTELWEGGSKAAPRGDHGKKKAPKAPKVAFPPPSCVKREQATVGRCEGSFGGVGRGKFNLLRGGRTKREGAALASRCVALIN